MQYLSKVMDGHINFKLVEIITVVAKTRDTLFVRLVGQTDEK